MAAVFLGDGFSLDESDYLGRVIANRSLVRAISLCDRIDRVLTVGDPGIRVQEVLGVTGILQRKIRKSLMKPNGILGETPRAVLKCDQTVRLVICPG